MSVTLGNQARRHAIGPGRERYLTQGQNLMMVVMDFDDGPSAEPDPPHNHPHEQITYVADGRVLFFLDQVAYDLGPGDMIAVPPNLPHTVQLLTPHVRLVDTFCPVREDFLD
jgi:quercetin dioxygenase-like cupin family protein